MRNRLGIYISPELVNLLRLARLFFASFRSITAVRSVHANHRVARAVLQRKAIAAIVKVVHVIATVHITSLLLCEAQKRQIPSRKLLGDHCGQSHLADI